MPDPSVAGLMATLVPQDTLTDVAVSAHEAFKAMPEMPSPSDDPKDWKDIGEFRKYIEAIDAAFTAHLEIVCDAGTSDTLTYTGGTLQATLPDGVSARLCLRTLVPAEHFEASAEEVAPFDPGIDAYAVGRRTITLGHEQRPCRVFRGPDLVVETMSDTLAGQDERLRELSAEMILCDPGASERAYTLRTAPT
jgi:hypothetical protein